MNLRPSGYEPDELPGCSTARHLASLTPGERIFRGVTRWQAGDEHRATLRALALAHHRLHDARHFYAIRAVRAGTPYELMARQMGHADVQMVARVYGRFAPRSDERDRWERIAALQDAQQQDARAANSEAASAADSGGRGTVGGTSSGAPDHDEAANALGGSGFDDSRGGTRTRDPGIMSAVL